MPAKHKLKIYLLICLLVGALLACNVMPNLTSNSTPGTTASGNSPALNTWTSAAPGVELRSEQWKSQGDNEDTVTITRFDLAHVHLKVGYQPDQPLSMSAWMKQEGAQAMINGGYFDAKNRSEGLVIVDGNAAGSSYTGFGGMLAVDAQGNVSLRSLHDQPYDPNNEQLQQVTQSSPMLMVNGKRTQFNANAASQRRSIVAMDTQGRLLLIVSPGSAFTLDELADLLVSSDLSLKTALNLDGGASTGLYVDSGSQKVSIDALTPLPLVIIVK